MPQHIHLGNELPNRNPDYIGQEYFDLSSQQFYKAIGTQAADWQLLGSGSGSGVNQSFFAADHAIEYIEGPGTVELNPSHPIYTVNMGGPGTKVITPPAGLSTNKRHGFIVYGLNTYSSGITVEIGNGANVSWAEGVPPTFPAGDTLVEILLFTLNGGDHWYGRVLGQYS